MTKQKALTIIRRISICSFVCSACCLSILTVLQLNSNWRFMVSLPGHTTFIVLLFISLYLCAIFRGISSSQRLKTEHPFTTSSSYLVFYDTSPLIGLLIGLVTCVGSSQIVHYTLAMATCSLMTTFVVWIVIDPLAGLFEMLLPSSRACKRKRIARNRTMRKKELIEKEKALIEMEEMEIHQRQQCESIVRMYADVLVDMVATCDIGDTHTETTVVDIGVKAWQAGGQNCMKELHLAVLERYKVRFKDKKDVDCISIWWDGVGHWRSELCETANAG